MSFAISDRGHDKFVIPALTGLRGVAAMMVLLGHASGIIQFSDTPVIGWLFYSLPANGMTVFFVLSGFVMWINYSEMILRGPVLRSVWTFAVARFARLYPLFITIVLFALATRNIEATVALMPDPLLFGVAMQAWFPGSNAVMATFSINAAHTWSISVEMLLYAFFPLAVFLISALKKPFWIVLFPLTMSFTIALIVYYCSLHYKEIGVAIAPKLSLGDINQWLTYYSPITRLPEFLIGCCAGGTFQRFVGSKLNRVDARRGSLLSFVTSLSYVCLLALFTAIPYTGIWYTSMVVFIRAVPVLVVAYLVYNLSRYRSMIADLLSSAIFIFVGEISYSLYLVHPYVLDLIQPAANINISISGLVWYVFRLTMIVAMTVLFAFGTYTLVEVPGRRFFRRMLSPSRASNVKLAAVACATAGPAP